MEKLSMVMLLSFMITPSLYAECINGDCIDGYGTFSYPNGDKYVGNWKNGDKEGQGTLTLANGINYVGGWKNGKRSGQGVSTIPNGNKYVGERLCRFPASGVGEGLGNKFQRKYPLPA